MEYIKINKKIITDRILELEKDLYKWSKAQSEGNYTLLSSEMANIKESGIELKTLQSILKQSEEIK